jgi:hypothetical protein
MQKRSEVLAVYAESLVFESTFGSASSGVKSPSAINQFPRAAPLLSLQRMPRPAVQTSCPSVIKFGWDFD